MRKISWNTEKAVESFVDELRYIEAVINLLDIDDENYRLGYDFERKKEIEDMWKKWDELRLALEDEFGVRL